MHLPVGSVDERPTTHMVVQRQMSEWYCPDCRKWNGGSCCSGCLKINPADVRWMSEYEIKREREKVLGLRR